MFWLALVGILAALVGNLAYRGASFLIRDPITPTPTEHCRRLDHEKLSASEDLALLQEGKVLLTSGAMLGPRGVFPLGSGQAIDGAIFLLDVATEKLTHLPVEGLDVKFVPHGLFYSNTTKRLYVVNHAGEPGGSRIEIIDVSGDVDNLKLKLRQSLTSEKWGHYQINDVVEASEDGSDLYVTNFQAFRQYANGTHGSGGMAQVQDMIQTMAGLSQIPLNKIWRCTTKDGECTVAAGRMVSPNGITISTDRRTVFVSELLKNTVEVFERLPSSELKWVSRFTVKHSIDNLEYDTATGHLTGGTIPDPLAALKAMASGARGDVPGSLLRITLLGTGGASFVDGTQTNVVMHDGTKMAHVSAGLETVGKAVLGSPSNEGVLVCDLP